MWPNRQIEILALCRLIGSVCVKVWVFTSLKAKRLQASVFKCVANGFTWSFVTNRDSFTVSIEASAIDTIAPLNSAERVRRIIGINESYIQFHLCAVSVLTKLFYTWNNCDTVFNEQRM